MQGLLGDLGRFGGNEGNPVAHETDFVVQRKSIQRARDRVGLPGGGINHARNILPGQYGGHSGQGTCPAGIDPCNAGMGVRRVQHFGVQQPAQFDIRGKGGFPLGELDGIHFRFGFANDLIRSGFRGEHDLWRGPGQGNGGLSVR